MRVLRCVGGYGIYCGCAQYNLNFYRFIIILINIMDIFRKLLTVVHYIGLPPWKDILYSGEYFMALLMLFYFIYYFSEVCSRTLYGNLNVRCAFRFFAFEVSLSKLSRIARSFLMNALSSLFSAFSLSLPISPPVANFLYLFPINQSKVAINLSVVVVKYVPINGNVLLAPQQNCLPRKIAVIRLTLIVSFSKLLSANIKLNRYRLYYFNSCVFWLGNSSKQAQNGLNTIKIPISKHMSSRMLIKFRVCESIG